MTPQPKNSNPCRTRKRPMYTVKINGTKHTVTTAPDGTKTYDPPLTPEQDKKFAKRCSEMLQSQTPPGTRSDTSFHAGRGTLLDQLEGDEVWAKHLTEKARKRGYNVGANDVYIGQMDDPQGGNPDAFLKPTEGRADLKRKLKKLGKGVDMPGMQFDPTNAGPKKKALNPKITKRLAQHYKQTGEAGSRTGAELKSYIEKKHGRPD